MEGIATGLAVDAAKAITKTVAGKAFEEISLVWGFNDELGKLKKRLSYIEAFLNDLGNKRHAQIQSELVDTWLKDVKKVACSAENLMDDYNYEMLRRKLEFKVINSSSSNNNNHGSRASSSLFKKKRKTSIAWKKCSNYVKPSTNPLAFRIRMTHRVKRILSEFDELYKDAERHGLKSVDLPTSTTNKEDNSLSQIRASPPTEIFIGRKKDQHILLQKLRPPSYSHHLPILQEMVESVTMTACVLKSKDTIIDELQEKLKGKRLFLMLDDVWNEDKLLWDSFISNLTKLSVLPGSVILITARNNNVAKTAHSLYEHKLEGLSKEVGWALLKQQVAFVSSLNDVAGRILIKCKGVPLAIKAIGSILQEMESPSDWDRLEKNEVWDIEQHHTDKSYIMPSLLLSYNHFNNLSLKQCFACCAIFPKDKVMTKRDLTTLWLAQDLLSDEYNSVNCSLTTTAETIGEKYIDCLVNHSFLLEEKNKYDHWDDTAYKIHDLVHDLASYISKNDLLVCKVADKVEDVDSNLRHLAFDSSENEIALRETLAETKLNKLRTIIIWNGVPKWNSLICAKYIHTLILAKLERHIETSRFLLASKGLGQLTSLQTLPRLDLCDGEGWTIDELGPLYQVKGEVYITGLKNLKNKEHAKEAGLKRKDKIVRLSLDWNVSYGEDEEESCGVHNDECVLDSLEPHPSINTLEIYGFRGVRFPEWMRTVSVKHLPSGHSILLNSLTRLELHFCKKCQQLPSLGQLPNLKFLRLAHFDAVEHIGEEFYESSNNNYTCTEPPIIPTAGGIKRKVSFPNLIRLDIRFFRKLTTWKPPSSSTTALPSLETLMIFVCGKLRKIPTSLEKCTSLQDLHIEGCPLIEGPIPDIGKLQRLANLKLAAGALSTSSPQWIPLLSHLTEVKILGLREEWDITLISSLTCLTSLSLSSCPNFKPLPAQKPLPYFISSSTLQYLAISEFDEMEALPEWIGNFSSLQSLELHTCKKLKWLPSSMQCLSQLQRLDIFDCPLLSGRCSKFSNNAPDSQLPIIKHIPFIVINGVSI
ncbi:Disease resistance protein RGA2 [Bienertia sinuspersici]